MSDVELFKHMQAQAKADARQITAAKREIDRLSEQVEQLIGQLRASQSQRVDDTVYVQRFIDIIDGQKATINKLREDLLKAKGVT